MAVVIDDLPPLMWHAELGKGLIDVWSNSHHRGVQLHDLARRRQQWTGRYEQDAWMRKHDGTVTREMEDGLMRSIARLDGTPFPATAKLVGRWARGRVHRAAAAETTYCAEVVAATYEEMGLLGAAGRRTTTTRASSGPVTTSSCKARRGWARRSGSSPDRRRAPALGALRAPVVVERTVGLDEPHEAGDEEEPAEQDGNHRPVPAPTGAFWPRRS